MAEFAKYYVEYLTMLFKNIANFFVKFITSFTDIFTKDIPGYVKNLTASASEFDIFGWVFFVITFLVGAIFLFFLSFRIAMLIRRYVLFRAKEVDKDQIIEELAREKEKNLKLTVEKNQLYAMKINSMYNGSFNALESGKTEISEEEIEVEVKEEVSRFSRLTALDKEYAIAQNFVSSAEAEKISLSEIVERFVNFSASQHRLYYDKKTIRTFIAGMATTKFLILEGISGTGKTSLPYAFSKFLRRDPSIISVQPSWRDRSDVMGYLNEFTKTYNESSFLASLYESTYRSDPTLVILDEMNLARIEYYFAEFLSVMEMPNKNEWNIEVVANEQPSDPKNMHDGKVLVPQSIWFIGTANQDDSTFTITDKVYDRAITLDLNNRAEYFDAPITDSITLSNYYFENLFEQAVKNSQISEKSRENLATLDKFIMSKFKITFGNRIMRQILRFVPVFCECGGDELEAIDFLLMSKILRKFLALDLIYLKKELKELVALLDKLFGKGKFKMSIDYINLLIERS